jgi:hypothetical protein
MARCGPTRWACRRPGVEMRIAENGEVFYRSPGVFVEYYKNPESTATPRMPRAGSPPAMPGSSRRTPGICGSSTGPRTWARWPMAPVRAEIRREQAEVLSQHPRGRGVRKRARMCTAFINIDLTRWATGPSATTSPTRPIRNWPGTRKVWRRSRACGGGEPVLAEDEMLSGCQVHRFLVLHKELDADDGELTRTRKVRRRIISEKFADLIDRALRWVGGIHRDRSDLRGRAQGQDQGHAGNPRRGRGVASREGGGGMIVRRSPFGLAPPAIPRGDRARKRNEREPRG